MCVFLGLWGPKPDFFTHGVGFDNFCGDKILDPTILKLNLRVKTKFYGLGVRLRHKLVKVRVRLYK